MVESVQVDLTHSSKHGDASLSPVALGDAYSEAIKAAVAAKGAAVQVSGVLIVVGTTLTGLGVNHKSSGLWYLASAASFTCMFAWAIFKLTVPALYVLIDTLEADYSVPTRHRIGEPLKKAHSVASNSILALTSIFGAVQLGVAIYTHVGLNWPFAG